MTNDPRERYPESANVTRGLKKKEKKKSCISYALFGDAFARNVVNNFRFVNRLIARVVRSKLKTKKRRIYYNNILSKSYERIFFLSREDKTGREE